MRLSDAFFRDIRNQHIKYDYGERIDGQPVYVGHAPIGTATSSDQWVMKYSVYNGSGNPTDEYIKVGIWDARVSLFS